MTSLLRIKTNSSYRPEREYILQVVFGDFLGLNYQIDYCQQEVWLITSEDRKKLILPDILFLVSEADWLTPDSLPKQPLAIWDTSKTAIDCSLVHPEVPLIFGNEEHSAFQFTPSTLQLRLPIDILGSAFFMLTRYEEVVQQERDEHGRFPAKASLAYQEDFLDRPIINEYVEILWSCLKHLWPHLLRKKQEFKVTLTHDIDQPFRYRTTAQVVRAIGRELLKRKNLRGAASWLAGGVRRVVDIHSDPFYRGVLHMMDISERYGLRGTFNFMGAPKGERDFGYNPSESAIQQLILLVHERGHIVGFHPGYTTATNLDAFLWQKKRVEKAYGHSISGGRQHYLRFAVPETWRIWEAAGAAYDSSLGYAERAGFRCGVCWPYSVFDLLGRCQLRVMEYPPIVMDGQLRADSNEALKVSEAYERVIQLTDACRLVGGEFILVWHNSSLSNEWIEWGRLYERLVADLAGMN
jgi:hypothetical protein